VSLSPLYLIHLLILHPRTNSKKGLCDLCVETDTKTGQTPKPIPKQGKRQNRYQNRANAKTDTKTEQGEEEYIKNQLSNTASSEKEFLFL
jgi:hypothetical protein